MRPPKRERDYKVPTAHGVVTVTRRPHSHDSNLLDKEQPSILVRGAGIWEFMGRWSLLCGVPTPGGGRVTINALEATPEQIVWAITNDESIFGPQESAST